MVEYLCESKSLLEVMGAAAGILAIITVLLNNRQMIQCFYLWIVSNLICAMLHFNASLWTLMLRDLMFIGLALEGIWKWSRVHHEGKKKITTED